MRLGSLGPVELLLIVVAIVLIFGASKIGDIGGALGKSIKEFRKASKDEEDTTAPQQVTVEAAEPEQKTVVAVTSTAPQQPAAPPVGDFRPPDTTTPAN